MAKSIKVTYYQNATATCSNCKSVYTLGLTTESLQLEICGFCHPFYSGKETYIDTGGRIQRFKDKLDSASIKVKKQKTSKTRKFSQSLSDFVNDKTQPEQELTVEVKKGLVS